MKMKIKLSIYIFMILSFATQTYADVVNNNTLKILGNASISIISTINARADLALCKSMIIPAHLKGDYGESIVGKYLLEQYSMKGQWTAISPRMGRQGIDQLFIKYDQFGRPRDILVGEVKYGTAQLGETKTGIQMGAEWINDRLMTLGNQYIKAASFNNMEFKALPSKFGNYHVVEVTLGNGEKAVFWRENSGDSWKYDGPKDKYETACERLKMQGNYLKKAGQGTIRVRRSIFETKIENGNFKIIHKDATQLDAGISQRKMLGKEIASYSIDSQLSKEALSESIAKQIKQKMGHLPDKQCYEMAEKIVEKTNNIENIKIGNYAFENSLIGNSMKAGVYGAAFTVAIEAISQAINEKLNYKRLLESGAIGFGASGTGVAIGQFTEAYLIKSAVANEAMCKMASLLGIDTSFMSNTIGEFTGGGAAAIFFAYAGYYLGYYDSYTANKRAAAGVVSVGGGMRAVNATFSLISKYATAETETASSSLIGVAADNELALSGGEVAASGAGGVEWGTMVLKGARCLTFVGYATIIYKAAMYCVNIFERKEENKLIALDLNAYCNSNCFKKQAQEIFPN